MKTLYLDCGMGAAGDMLCAALLQLVPEPEAVLNKIRAMKLPGVSIAAKSAQTNGIQGLQFNVTVDGHDEEEPVHHHSCHHLGDIEQIIRNSGLEQTVVEDAIAVYHLLAQAESAAHGCSMEHIHFHEVGTLDAVVDITTACLLFRQIKADIICASPIHVGSGTVKCAHGVLPVPAPATAKLLEGIPIYSSDVSGELCTPTGAALLKYFVTDFGVMPEISPTKIGYGIGHKQFARANCLRAVLGESGERIIELQCNVDDMTGEAIGNAISEFVSNGALDACWQPIGMKKNRPGFLLSVMCTEKDRERMVRLMFSLTSTIGIREALCQRYVLQRKGETIETQYGPVRVKRSDGYGVERVKPEADDIAAIATQTGIPFEELKSLIGF